jgi:hypothetical protein
MHVGPYYIIDVRVQLIDGHRNLHFHFYDHNRNQILPQAGRNPASGTHLHVYYSTLVLRTVQIYHSHPPHSHLLACSPSLSDKPLLTTVLSHSYDGLHLQCTREEN